MAIDQFIEIKNARVNNLKGINLKIPRGKLIVITGVSGSGKSSLAFDTLYAEGQRRYVESLNSYARQFLGRNSKPEVDSITGIPPAIAIEQKVNTRNPRSTVGTSTEIYDYLRLLYARVGKTYSPVSGCLVKHDTVTDAVDFALSLPDNTTLLIMSPLKPESMEQTIASLKLQGFSRLEHDGEIIKFAALDTNAVKSAKGYNLIVDRLSLTHGDDLASRLAESIGTAMNEGDKRCVIRTIAADGKVADHAFSSRFEADGIVFEEPNELMFTFNSPISACPTCQGFGRVIGYDHDLIIPDPSLSVANGCVAPWTGPSFGKWKTEFCRTSQLYKFPVYKPYFELSPEEKDLLWNGKPDVVLGINDFFSFAEHNQYKIQYRILISRFRGKTICPECNGSRLRKEATYVRVGDKDITQVCKLPISDLKTWVDNIRLDDHDAKVAQRILTEIRQRVNFLIDVGLDYLTLNRLSSTLSGGESQRINLATSLGSSLVGSLYILDEPSIGLHSADTTKLISVLRKLQKLGNTVVVVEHDEDIIRSADDIIDIGPEAGRFGGEVVFSGSFQELLTDAKSLTAQYLTGKIQIPVPRSRRYWNESIDVKHATTNNLKDVTATFPLNAMTVVTGVSGSGKSSLVTQILYPELRHYCSLADSSTSAFKHLYGNLSSVKQVEFVDQNPIGKSTRSNPVTYIKAYEEIRKLMSSQPLAKQNNYTSAFFSFNAPGGRCEACQGEGNIKIEMQFMADVVIQCDQCHGKRFKDDILEVKYRDKNIYDILDMTVNQAIEFFSQGTGATEKKIVQRLKPLQDVGIGYIKMGQSSSTLSGGENQRVKLASYLADANQPPTLFIFDEPTTGLHFHDINKLLTAFNSLIEKGHTLVIIEHNMDVIKSADWLIDLGPDGGDNGGRIVFQGTPDDAAQRPDSKTGLFLKKYLSQNPS